ncbi:MAG: transporter substrate-binding domain-containing protein [Oleiphilaceae bacterium]|nr:transporter substrate-binding domain-containing protein [Oleiphilaceae bacterium]
MLQQISLLLISLIFLMGLHQASYAETPLTITYGDSYIPFAWGSNDQVRGVQVDFVEEIIAKRLGVPVKHEGCPWKRCQLLVKDGKRDGFFTVPTQARSEYTRASELPFYKTRFLMHTAKNNPLREQLASIQSLKDLQPLTTIRHIHMLGSGWQENALKNMRRVQTIPDAAMIPYMLVKQRADLYVEQKEMFQYQAQMAGLENEVHTFESPVIRTLGWHLFIGHKSPHQPLMARIDTLLKALQESGELEALRKEIFARYEL